MDEADLIAMLRATFSDEAREGLLALNQLLCDAEAAGLPREEIDRLYRTAHNLKGAAAAADLPDVVAVLHELETAFSAWRDESVVPTAESFDGYYRSLDEIGHLLGLETGAAVPSAMAAEVEMPVAEAIPVMAYAGAEEMGAPLGSPVAAPSAAPSPVPQTAEAAGNREQSRKRSDEGDTAIRIAVDKLSGLMAKIGEILLVRIKSEQRLSQTKALRERLVTQQRRHAQAMDEARRFLAAEGTRYRRLAEYIQETTRWLRDTETAISQLEQAASRDHTALSILSANLQDDIKQLMLQPLAALFDLMPRVARDASRLCDKRVQLQIRGGDTELDRQVVEALKDPLTHLVRNAVDHGIEAPADRLALGKPESGSLTLSAAQVGSHIVITLSDDGRGIDHRKVAAKMVAQGRWTQAQAEAMTPEEIHQAILTPGLSTADTVTAISGRGVGMDVVATQLKALKGSLHIQSLPGEGTRMQIRLPVSMVTAQGLLLSVSDQTYALPIDAVERLVRVRPADVKVVQSQQVVHVGGSPLSLVPLDQLLPLPVWARPTEQEREDWIPLIVLQADGRRLALAVDHLVGEQEMVIKPLGFPMAAVPYVSGATLDGAGRVVLILDPAKLVHAESVAKAPLPKAVVSGAAPEPTILVVDDSPTIQQMQRDILEGAGFQVLVASDGHEAWQILQETRTAIAFVDLDMPRMNGFDLIARIRQDAALRSLPVVVVSTRADEATVARVHALGIQAFVSKQDMNPQQFLRLIAEHL